MNFESPNSCLTQIHNMLLSQQVVMGNRARINRLFNGEVPETDEECEEQNIKTRANWLEGTRIASNATSQINNSLFKGERYFSVQVDKGPPRFRSMMSNVITKEINRELKRSDAYKGARESSNAQVVLHGPGPLVWRNRRGMIPNIAGVDDVLVPSGTILPMGENLDYLSIYREMTWPQLDDAVMGDVVDPGWNKDYTKALLATMYKTGLQPVYQGNRWMMPEKLAEDIKEGSARMASSSLPKLLAWDFFYRDQDSGKINRRMILDYANITATGLPENASISKPETSNFIYEKDGYSDDWSEIIHWYIGNCSNVAPYRYYSIRSIGYLLYGPCLIQNKARNRAYDHLFQAFLTLFNNVSDDFREKVNFIDLNNFGILPQGVSMVPASERHQVDWELVNGMFQQTRQLMQESSTGFLPDMPSGTTGPTMTAYETMVRQQMAVTYTSAVLNKLGDQSRAEYREICRRVCLPNNPDPMVKRIRKRIRDQGVPDEMMDIEAWDVISELSLGGGSKAVELSMSQALTQEIMPAVGPDAQRDILRQRIVAITDNAMLATTWVPEAPQPESDDAQYAQVAFSVLMLGVPFTTKEGINRTAYVVALMGLMKISLGQVQALIQQPIGLPITADRLAGLANCVKHVEEVVQLMARDPHEQQIAKSLWQALQQMMQGLQQLAKQLMAMEQEQGQQQGGIPPETQAKIQERLMLAQTNSKILEQKAQEKLKREDILYSAKNLRENAKTHADIERENVKTVAGVHRMHAQTRADIAALDLTTQADIIRQQNEPKDTSGG